jgi:predicted DNA-binding antitoxin AbrB/MazE fold protein
MAMARLIEAVFEKGVFRPLQPVDLKDGQHVKVALPPSAATTTVTPEDEKALRAHGYGIFADISDEDWQEIARSWERK